MKTRKFTFSFPLDSFVRKESDGNEGGGASRSQKVVAVRARVVGWKVQLGGRGIAVATEGIEVLVFWWGLWCREKYLEACRQGGVEGP